MSVSDGTLPRRVPLAYALVLVLLAAVALFWVYGVNGGALLYDDSALYLDIGQRLLGVLGIDFSATELVPLPVTGEEGAIASSPDVASPDEHDNSISGVRSIPYMLLAGLAAELDAIGILVFVNAAAIALATWLIARVLGRHSGLAVLPLATWPLIICAASSLPFYVAYLMPDLFAGITIMMIALVLAFGASMHRGEIVGAWVLAVIGIAAHITHLAIAALILPVAILMALIIPGPRRWLGTVFVLLLVGTGLAQKMAVSTAARSVDPDAVVTYMPYLTIRIIADGPGYTYLERHCPAAEIQTCILYDALQKSDDPWRLTPSHIAFATDPQIGSFALLEESEQALINAEHLTFVRRVFFDQPLATILSFAGNVFAQVRSYSIEMTLQTDTVVEHARSLMSGEVTGIRHGRLTTDQSWLPRADSVLSWIYLGALLLAGGLLLFARPLDGRIRTLGLLIICGILANAVICGGVSQPAPRYGARVIWLVPFMATLLTLLAIHSQPRKHQDP